jgi:hypothetical protein
MLTVAHAKTQKNMAGSVDMMQSVLEALMVMEANKTGAVCVMEANNTIAGEVFLKKRKSLCGFFFLFVFVVHLARLSEKKKKRSYCTILGQLSLFLL